MGLVQLAKGHVGAEPKNAPFIASGDMSDVLVRTGLYYRADGALPTLNAHAADGVILVREGQAVLIVQNGKICDFAAEPGAYAFKPGAPAALFTGGKQHLAQSFRQVGLKAEQSNLSHAVYYVNTSQITRNKFGVGEVPFRDSRFRFPLKLKGYGLYTYAVTDPLIFFTHLPEKPRGDVWRTELEREFKAEFQQALCTAITNLAYAGYTYDTIAQNTPELMRQLDTTLDTTWKQKRGIESVAVAFIALEPDEQSAQQIAQVDQVRRYFNQDVLDSAAGNDNTHAATHAAEKSVRAPLPPTAPITRPEGTKPTWQCTCGERNSGNFCSNCGAKKPQGCKHRNATRWATFCPDCGAKLK